MVGLAGLWDWWDFEYPNLSFWRPGDSILTPWDTILAPVGGQGVRGNIQDGTLGSNHWFFMIFGGFRDPPADQFFVNFWVFSWFGLSNVWYRCQCLFVCDLGMEIIPELDARMCWNHTKNNGFHQISLFDSFFMILVSPGEPWDLILKALGTLGVPCWWF